LTPAEYRRAYADARRELARCSIADGRKIRKEYMRAFSLASRSARESRGRSLIEDRVRRAFPRKELHDFIMETVLNARYRAASLVAGIGKRYIFGALDQAPGHGLSKDRIAAMFDELAEGAKIPNSAAPGGIAMNDAGEPPRLLREYTRHVDRKAHSLSKSIWDTVGHTEEAILNTVRGSISQGRDIRTIAADIMAHGRFGPAAIPGRWGKLLPGTREYARRLGRAGVDYRVIRLRRSEQYRMMQEKAIAEGQSNPACTGEYDWIMFEGGNNCEVCEDLEAGSPYTYDTVPAYPHPNCMCTVRPRLKPRAEFMKELRAYASGEPGGSGIARWAQEKGLREPAGGAGIESQLGIAKGEPAGMRQALLAANANADKTRGFQNNCQRSVVAYELQRRGFRVTAMPAIMPRSQDFINAGYECFVGSQLKHGGRRWSDLSGKLNGHPVGSRFGIVWNWKGGSGHTIVAERTRNGIRFFDAQEGAGISMDALPSIQRIEVRNGIRHLFFYRMDNLPLDTRLDFARIVSPHSVRRNIDNFGLSAIIYEQVKKMTKDEARKILEQSEELAPYTNENDDDRETWHYKVGDFYKEAPDAFGFAVYAYSAQTPIDPLFAFAYWVLKESGEVTKSTYPISEKALKKLTPPS